MRFEVGENILQEPSKGAAETTERLQMESEARLSHEKTTEDLNQQIRAIKQLKKDALDFMAANIIRMFTNYCYVGFSVGGNFTSSVVPTAVGVVGICMEVPGLVQSLTKSSTVADRSMYKNYRIQCLFARQSAAKISKGSVVVLLHPPLKNQEDKAVTHSEMLHEALRRVGETEADAAILPLEPAAEHPGASNLHDLIEAIKGYKCTAPYPEDAQALLLTRQELNNFLIEQPAGFSEAIMRAVARAFPSSASRLQAGPASQRQAIIEQFLEQELQAESAVRRRFFDDFNEFDIKKESRTPQISGSNFFFRGQASMREDTRMISSLAPFDPSHKTEIIQKVMAGGYSNLELLSLAWQSLQDGFEQDEAATEVGSKLDLQPRKAVAVSMRDSLRAGPEWRRWLGRVIAAGLGTVAVLALLKGAQPPHSERGVLDEEKLGQGASGTPALFVRAYGNASINGYYASQAYYDLDGDKLRWLGKPAANYDINDYPNHINSDFKDYLEVAQRLTLDEHATVPLAVKEGTTILALNAVDSRGRELHADAHITDDWLYRVRIEAPEGASVKLTYYLVPAEGMGAVRPSQPIAVLGNHRPEEDPTLPFDVPAENQAKLLREKATYNAGKPLQHMLEGAHAGNLAAKVMGPDGVADCSAAATTLALNQSVAHYDNAAYVTGYALQDSGPPGEEYVNLGHAWLATDTQPHIDATPPLPAGATNAEVGLPEVSQSELAHRWQQTERVLEDEQPFPWQPLSVLGGLGLAAATLRYRQSIGLATARLADTVRSKLYPNQISAAALRQLLAYESFSNAGGNSSINANDFSALRDRLLRADETITDASVSETALKRVIEQKSAVTKALLTPREQRHARHLAASILRERQRKRRV